MKIKTLTFLLILSFSNAVNAYPVIKGFDSPIIVDSIGGPMSATLFSPYGYSMSEATMPDKRPTSANDVKLWFESGKLKMFKESPLISDSGGYIYGYADTDKNKLKYSFSLKGMGLKVTPECLGYTCDEKMKPEELLDIKEWLKNNKRPKLNILLGRAETAHEGEPHNNCPPKCTTITEAFPCPSDDTRTCQSSRTTCETVTHC